MLRQDAMHATSDNQSPSLADAEKLIALSTGAILLVVGASRRSAVGARGDDPSFIITHRIGLEDAPALPDGQSDPGLIVTTDAAAAADQLHCRDRATIGTPQEKRSAARVMVPPGTHSITEETDMAEAGTLHDAFIDELRDTYDAEKQLTKALPKWRRRRPTQAASGLREPSRGDTRPDCASRTGLRELGRKGPRQTLRRYRRHHRRRQVDHGRGLR